MNELTAKSIKPEWIIARGVILLRMPRREPQNAKVHLTARMVRNEPNAHVRAYWRQKTREPRLTPLEYVRREAKAQGINYDILTSRRHRIIYYRQRKTVLLRTMRRYPNLSTPQLGSLFQRHWTSILYSLGRTGTAKRRRQAND